MDEEPTSCAIRAHTYLLASLKGNSAALLGSLQEGNDQSGISALGRGCACEMHCFEVRLDSGFALRSIVNAQQVFGFLKKCLGFLHIESAG